MIARGVLLDVAGTQGVDTLPDAYGITPKDLQDTIAKQALELRRGDVVLVRTGRMRVWPDFDGFLEVMPGIDLARREIALRGDGRDVHRPRHGRSPGVPLRRAGLPPRACYMFATAGTPIIEVLHLEELAAEISTSSCSSACPSS